VAAVQTQFAQGSFETTGNATDLAIDGEGFFMVKDANDATYFTRAGAFHISEDGLLVDGNDYQVQGYNTFRTAGTLGTDTSDEETAISLKNVQSSPKTSTEISLGANLDESAAAGEKFSVSQTVYDTKGKIHTVAITFLRTEGNGMWGFDAKLDESLAADPDEQTACGMTFDSYGKMLGMYKGDIASTTAVTAGDGAIDDTETVVSRHGQLYKDSDVGGITLTKEETAGVWSVTTPGGYDNAVAWQETLDGKEVLKVDLDGAGGNDIIFTLNNTWAEGDTVSFEVHKTDVALSDQTLSFGDLGSGALLGETEGTGADVKNKINWNIVGEDSQTITGYASTSVVKSLSDNGYTSGILKSLAVDGAGIINGFFTNGQTSQLGQLILADFPNPSGLKKVGNYFGATTESGDPIKNKPGAGGLGEIMSNSLEISNTDVAKEFINMITAQRAYQASSRIITTADEMLTELMNIKR